MQSSELVYAAEVTELRFGKDSLWLNIDVDFTLFWGGYLKIDAIIRF